MKTARYLFTFVALGVLTPTLGYAGEPSKPPAEKNIRVVHSSGDRPAHRDSADGKPSVLPNDGHALEKSSGGTPMNTQTKRASAYVLYQPGLKKAATAGHGGGMINGTGNHHEPPARWPGGGGTSAPWSSATRGRGAVAAGLGGLTASTAKNSSAALNGATIKRKP